MVVRGVDLIDLWEAGEGRSLLDKGLVLLGLARPSLDPTALADVSIGERNRAILELRSRLWGDRLVAEARCPQCAERLEMEFQLREVLAQPRHDATKAALTTRDLATVEGMTRSEARRLLLARLGASEDANNLDQDDPLAEIVIEPKCPACDHVWQVFLDPVGYVWSELETRAMSLMRDVHRLARSYGWSESEVLSLTPRRRLIYLRLSGAI